MIVQKLVHSFFLQQIRGQEAEPCLSKVETLYFQAFFKALILGTLNLLGGLSGPEDLKGPFGQKSMSYSVHLKLQITYTGETLQILWFLLSVYSNQSVY